MVARRHTPGIGAVLGIASGTGFAVLETMGYGFTTLLGSGRKRCGRGCHVAAARLVIACRACCLTGLIVWALWRTRATFPARVHPGSP
ncbi:PrsW family glutamic-type intramembrane protease [Propioniciclava flava]